MRGARNLSRPTISIASHATAATPARIWPIAMENWSAPAEPMSATTAISSRRLDVIRSRSTSLKRGASSCKPEFCGRERALGRGDHCRGRNPRQTTEISRRAYALIARAALELAALDRFSHKADTAPGGGADRQRRPVDTDDRDRARRGNVQRSAIPADEERRALEE